MKGMHHVVIESPRLKYEFDVRRNITVIAGDSATGKTTLVELIREFQTRGLNSPIRIESDVKCVVYGGANEDWHSFIREAAGNIVFIDEGYTFIFSREFAAAIENTDNYYVFITRRALTCLPYSIHEIYGIRTTGRYYFPEKIYNELYELYSDFAEANEAPVTIITEDSKSGYQFMKACCDEEVICVSAEGNSNIYSTIREQSGNGAMVVLADGAAFGAYIAKVLAYAKLRKKLILYMPESFEWVVLKSGVIKNTGISQILSYPEEYIDSRQYFSWDRFFTDYLVRLTENDSIRRYTKQVIGEFYITEGNRKQILKVYPEIIQKMLQQ